jgi:hypothetical protein
MVERLTVVFFVILCLLLGTYLTFAPWDTIFGQWSNNHLIAYIAQITGIPAIQSVASSTWVRGGVSGLGVLNILLAMWEITHFEESVRMLESDNASGRR